MAWLKATTVIGHGRLGVRQALHKNTSNHDENHNNPQYNVATYDTVFLHLEQTRKARCPFHPLQFPTVYHEICLIQT